MDKQIWDTINNKKTRELGKILYKEKIIPYERFLSCHLEYLDKYRKAKRELQARRDDLYESLDSLIAHPETGKAFKTHLLETRRNI